MHNITLNKIYASGSVDVNPFARSSRTVAVRPNTVEKDTLYGVSLLQSTEPTALERAGV